MTLLQVKDLSKSFGVVKIFELVSFHVQEREKIGLVGPNGAGKTTLLRCLTGEDQADSGEVVWKDKLSYGYLQQLPQYAQATTLFDVIMESFADLLLLRAELKDLETSMGQAEADRLEYIMAKYSALSETYERAGGFACESTARKIASGLGFEDTELRRDVNSFSGGEKTRAGLARLLAREPELLLLDEPTNHLDLAAVEWLEDYLRAYKGALLVISHDRYFLDRITAKTLELAQTRLCQYPGTYTRYLELKAERLLAQTRAFAKQQVQIKAAEEYINKYRAGIKAKQARGRQAHLERVQRLEAPTRQGKIHLNPAEAQVSGNVVLVLQDASFGFPGKPLFSNVNLQLNKGEKVALLGSNGIGKSSLLKLVMGIHQPLTGHISLGSRVKVGYFDQEHAGLTADKRVIDEIIYNFAVTEREARNHLAAFLFEGDEVFKRVKELSGGEKGRLSFLKLTLAKPNFLVLDEPTNHLDIPAKQVVESYLADFAGTVLVVSHDRFFLDQTVSRVVELTAGGLQDYPGDYSYYKEKKALAGREVAAGQNDTPRRTRELAAARPKLNKAKVRAQVDGLEREISTMEARLAELTDLLANPDTYQTEQAKDIVKEYQGLEEKIPQNYAEWERLCDILVSDNNS